MAERNPPSWLQGGSHPAEHDRLVLASLVPSEGVVGLGDLAVTENGTPDMSVDVAAGAAFVKNDLATYGGMYHVQNDAVVNLAVTAADPTNPRKDLVVARVNDAQYAGGTDAWALAIITGTPAASPAEPAIPVDASYLVLALIDVAAGATTITDAVLTDRRARAAVPANNAIPAGAMMPYAGTGAPAGWLLCDGAAVSRTLYSALFSAIGTAFGSGDGSTTFNLPDTRSRSLVGAGQGTGLSNRALGGTGGAETVGLALGEMPAHSHTVASHNHTGSSIANESGHVHALNHAHALTGGNHSHALEGDYGFRAAVSFAGASEGLMDAYDGVGVTFTDIDHENILATGEAGSTNLAVSSQNGNSQGGASHGHGITIANQAPATDSKGSGTAHANMHPWLAVNHIIKAF